MAENFDFFGQDANEPKISLADIIEKSKEYLSYVWSKKIIIAIVGVVGAIIGLLTAIFQKVDYTATYKFTIETGSQSGGTGSLLALVGLGGGDGASAFSGNNLVELIKSRTMVENALLMPVEHEGDTITLIEYKLICDSVRKACEKYVPDPDAEAVSPCEIEYPVGQNRSTFTRAQDSLLMAIASGMMTKSIQVEKIDKKLNFVNFSFTSKNEEFSKLYATALLQVVNEFYVNSRTERTIKNIESFRHQADSIRKEMDKALYHVASIRDANLNSVAKVQVERLKYETEVKINGEAYTEIEKNIKVMELDLAREMPLIKVVDEPIYPLQTNKKGKLMSMIKFGIVAAVLAALFFAGKLYFSTLTKKEEKPAKIE